MFKEVACIANSSAFSHLPSILPAAGWSLLEGDIVEIYSKGHLIDRGIVDAVTSDGLTLWLSQEGATPRRLVQKEPAMTVSVFSSPLQSVASTKSQRKAD